MATGWRPTIGDHVFVTLAGNEHAKRYVIRGTSGERVLLHEVWCEGGQARESTRRREVRWSDLTDLRPAGDPDC